MVLGHVKYWQLLECKKSCGRASYDIEINHIEIQHGCWFLAVVVLRCWAASRSPEGCLDPHEVDSPSFSSCAIHSSYLFFLEESLTFFFWNTSFFWDSHILQFTATSCSVRTFLLPSSYLQPQFLTFLLVTHELLFEPLAALRSCEDPQWVPRVCEVRWSRRSTT